VPRGPPIDERMLAELLEAPLQECCDRGERPRCCSRIHGASERSPKRALTQRRPDARRPKVSR